MRYLRYSLILLVFSGFVEKAQTQDISALEYYIDDGDLGAGLNTPLPTSGGASILETFTIPTSSLSEGFHTLYIRIQDLSGQWGVPESRTFYISASNLTTQATVVDIEYFIDSDPGYGNGISLGPFTSTNVATSPIIPTSGLAAGFHVFYTRALDSDGTWGNLESRSFYVSESDLTTTANIVELRYYIDTDPGIGNGTIIPINSSTSIDVSTIAATNTLPGGHHTIHFRTMDADGVWSEMEARSFFVDQYAPGLISAVEYFYDGDPGYGNGNMVLITPPSASIDQTINLPTTSLSAGPHELGIRVINDNGTTGMTDYYPFNLCDAATADFTSMDVCIGTPTTFTDTSTGVLAGDVYSWDFDTDGIEDDNTVGNTSFTYASEGSFTASLIIDRSGCRDSTGLVINVLGIPVVNFSNSNACEGSPTDFTDLSTGTLGTDVYSWDFDGDGFIDSNIAGDVSFTYVTAGTYTASLTIDRTSCSDTFSQTVTVENSPVANAGVDQDLCVDNTVLNATSPGSNETGIWNIVSGSGTISDPTDPTSNFSGITSFSNQLQWTITNTVVGCSDSDEVLIASNQPINTNSVNATVALGETIETDVQIVATANPGDMLTTTILGQPSKGVASVLANGNIQYTPNDGTVGMDNIDFRLCNQCDNCTDSFLSIDIQNNAPVIEPGVLTVDPEGRVEIDLLAIISDANNNFDPSSLSIVQQPISGAIAEITSDFRLTIDYTNVVFVGTDELAVEACDLEGACDTSIIFIDVNLPGDPPITIFNAISPNGDDKHDFLEIENIDFYTENSIVIYNRWGSKVYEANAYDNVDIKFTGEGNINGATELPGGTYFYQLNLGNGTVMDGFFILKN